MKTIMSELEAFLTEAETHIAEFLKTAEGTHTWADGDKYVGEWRDGTLYDREGNALETNSEAKPR